MQYLSSLDELTSVDSIVSNGQKINLTIQQNRRGRGITWTATEGPKDVAISTYKWGVNHKGFIDAIKNIDLEENIEYPDVLCLKETQNAKTWDGKIVAKFFQIDPFAPYQITDNGIEIPEYVTELTQEEYNQILETKLALFTMDEVIYPIRESAIRSLGQKLDSELALKKLQDVPVSAAITIAENLMDDKKNGLTVVARKRTDRVHPIIGFVNPRWKKESQYDFFNNVFNYMASKGMYEITSWSISDECTTCTLNPKLLTIFKPEIIITISDKAGCATSCTANASIGEANIEIKSNKIRHSQEKVDIYELFDGIYESIYQYDKKLSKSIQYSMVPKDFKNITAALGKKRTKAHPFLQKKHEGEALAYNLLRNIIDNSYESLPIKQAGELAKAYASILDKYY